MSTEIVSRNGNGKKPVPVMVPMAPPESLPGVGSGLAGVASVTMLKKPTSIVQGVPQILVSNHTPVGFGKLVVHRLTEERIVGPDEAEFMLDRYAFQVDKEHPLNRDVIRRNVDDLVRAMEEGYFLSIAPIIFVTCCDYTFNVDGKNRLTAIIKSKMPQRLCIDEHVVENPTTGVLFRSTRMMYDCLAKRTGDKKRSLALAMAQQFYEYIDRNRQRTDNAHGKHIDYIFGLNKKQGEVLRGAVRVIASGLDRHGNERPDPEGMHSTSIEWVPYLLDYWKAINDKCTAELSDPMRTKPVAAMAMITFKHCPDRAAKFWEDLASQEKLGRYSPARMLGKLLEDGMRQSEGGSDQVIRTRAIATAWNAYFNGEDLPTIDMKAMVELAKVPIRIEGTPYNGKSVKTGLVYLR